jgi:hypothetical protein
VRRGGVPRWAAPVSVAAVLVLALGIVLKVQREAPESPMPVESRAIPAEVPAASAPEPPAAIVPASPATDARQAMAQRAQKKVEAKHAAPPKPAAARFEVAPEAGDAASAAPAAAAPASAAPAPALAEKRSESSAARDAAPRANIGAAPLSAQRAVAIDPLQRELERIARLREEGKNDEADTALVAFQREHPDFRIEPAMWERVRRR